MNNENDLTNIDQYYSSINKNLLSDLCKNNNLKNLIKLSTLTDIYIFNKKNKKWSLKSRDKLLKECETIKKKEIKLSSSILSNLAKLNCDTTEIKNTCWKLENKLSNLDKIITCINNLNKSTSSESKKNIVSFDLITINVPTETKTSSDNYIECYGNC
jgi:hypothetical protein